MRFMRFYVCSFMALLCISADWPQEAKEYLGQLPGKRLEVEYVLGIAVREADVFSLHKADYMKSELAVLSTISAEDLKLKGSYLYIDNRNEPFSPFMPQSTKGWEARLGMEKYFSTGTAVSVEAFNTPKQLQFQTIPDIDYTETRLSLGIDQSISGDFFGSSYRSQRQSAYLNKEALEFGAITQIENSALDTVKLYYQAWYKQQAVKNLKESLKRKQRLNSIFKSQERRGLIETSDALQVESTTLNNETELINSSHDLQSSWEQLVIQLKMPKSFLQVSAEEIPIALDTPEKAATEYCQKLSFEDIQANTTQIKQAQKIVESNIEKYAALKQKLLPDVRLQGNYVANAIDGSPRQTWRDAGNLDNPAWTAGINVSFPIQNRAQKAQVISAHIELDQSKTRLNLLKSNLEVQWRNICQQLNNKIKNRDILKVMNAKNQKRASLDTRRFEVGRIKAFQWVQSEDDEALSFLRLQQAEVEVRTLSWEIFKQTGHLVDKALQILQLKAQNE